MTKLPKTTTALILAAALLLSGCAEQINSPAQGTENTFSDSGTSTDSESSASGNESIDEPQSSTDSVSGNSVSGNNQLVIPTEYTDEDRELQEILKDLWSASCEIEGMFIGTLYTENPYYTFKFSDYDKYYYLISVDTRTQPDGLLTVPQTFEGMKALLLEYLTSRSVDHYMMEVNKGTLTENPDGTFTVKPEDEQKGLSTFMEIDGKMYYSGGPMGRNGLDCETAKVIEKKDDTIIFSCIASYGEPDYINEPERSWNIEGMLKFERGGWKLNYHYITLFEFD